MRSVTLRLSGSLPVVIGDCVQRERDCLRARSCSSQRRGKRKACRISQSARFGVGNAGRITQPVGGKKNGKAQIETWFAVTEAENEIKGNA